MAKKRKNRKKNNRPAAPASSATEPAKPPSPNPTMLKVGRWSAIILGVVFLLAASFKLSDPWSFLGSLPAYGVPSAARLPVTVMMPTIEAILGIMLIAGWKPRIAAGATAGFLVVFGGVIAYGWSAGTLQECGCFGPLLKRTPPQALAQDAVLLAMAVLGVVWAPRGKSDMSRFRTGTLATVGVLSMVIVGSTLSADPGTLEERIMAAEFAVEGEMPSLEDLDLANRDVILYLFHPECPHCVDNGPAIALIAEDPDLPEVIGITFDVDPGQVAGYQSHAGAEFPAYEFLPADFVRITGDGAVPQLVYLKKGKIARKWKGTLPTPVVLKGAIAAID